jgi:hypothetical protein
VGTQRKYPAIRLVSVVPFSAKGYVFALRFARRDDEAVSF